MPSEHDVIVVGVGGIGSAATYHLARQGVDVLGLDRFDIPHSKGSSHGYTRIFQPAYFVGSSYTPLLNRANELWKSLQETYHTRLLHRTGTLNVGPEGCTVVDEVIRACQEYDLDHELLTSSDITDRYPAYQIPPDYEAVFQPGGGILEPENCIIAHVEQAHEHGAEIRARERVLDWNSNSDSVSVRTDRGEYRAENLVITAGAWAAQFVGGLNEIITPERHVVGRFHPRTPAHFEPNTFPPFVMSGEDDTYYGIPPIDAPGFKFGRYQHMNRDVDPDSMQREPTVEDEERLRSPLKRYFPSGDGPTMALDTCLITNSPDDNFIIDTLPGDSNVVVGAGFAGHGYMIGSAIGEILADLTVTGATEQDISQFRLDRFCGPS
jgi:sarcosine oxidase